MELIPVREMTYRKKVVTHMGTYDYYNNSGAQREVSSFCKHR
jgi:hypothetical protein